METKNNINMRPAPKKNDNGLIGGALGAAIGTAFGATFGVGGAYAYSHLTGDDDIPEITIEPQLDEEVEIAQHPEPHHHHEVHHVHQTSDVYIVQPEPTPTPGPTPGPTPEPEIQVLSYGRVTADDGSQMDMAIISYNGQEAAIVDVDLDGWADGMIADANSDGNISEDEITSFEGTDIRINMGDLAQAAGYTGEEIDPSGGAGSEVVIYDEGEGEGESEGEESGGSDDGMLTVSNDGGDGVMPDYVNNGDVSDVVTDSDDMLLV